MDALKEVDKIKIHGLLIYCTKCRNTVTEKCGATGKKIGTCPNKEKHKYKVKVYIPGTKGKYKSKLIETRNITEAIKQTIEFRKELENNNFSQSISTNKTIVPKTIVEGMAFYISYLNNETPHEQEHKLRSQGHLKEVERYLTYFLDYLETVNINPKILLIEKVDKSIVGKLKSFLLEKKNYSPKTYNKYIGMMRVFISFLMEEFDLKMKNPFRGFKRLKTEQKINTISKTEFHELLKIITPENGIQILFNKDKTKKTKKNRYKSWLKDALLLALLTGRRREEIIRMKYNGILENASGEPISIRIEDYKVNRSNDISNKESVKFIYVPIITPLKNLLIKLGYKEYKGQDKYILAPEESMERKTMMDFISKSFTHYYKLLNTGKDLQFYDLRKTYISHLYATHGEKARIITKHSGEEVMMKHYIDEKVIAEVAMDFELFEL